MIVSEDRPLNAHLEMYVDGRTHLTLEDESDAESPIVVKMKEVLSDTVKTTLGEKLVPGSVFAISVTKIRPIRRTVEFSYKRVR